MSTEDGKMLIETNTIVKELSKQVQNLVGNEKILIETYSKVDILDEREGRHNDEVKSEIRRLGDKVENSVKELSNIVFSAVESMRESISKLKKEEIDPIHNDLLILKDRKNQSKDNFARVIATTTFIGTIVIVFEKVLNWVKS